MSKNTNIQSVEPNIADLVNGWLKSYKLDYKLEQESLNTEIDQALDDYYSKSGGKGGNRPDAKLLLQANDGKYYPVLIEYKGYKDKLVKLDAEGNVANKTAKNQPDFTNIKAYAVNGAVHYSNAVLHYTSYTDVIAIGVTGYKAANGKIKHLIGVYYVSKSNFGVGQKVDEYTDLSFLKKEHFSAFIEKVKQLSLPQDEIEKLKDRREQEITASLVKLNNDIFAASNIAQKYNCVLKRLDYQQEQGFMSSLALGVNQLEIERGMTTSSTAIFVPFLTCELFQEGEALYYGLNAISNNMIMANRKTLKNPKEVIRANLHHRPY